MKNLKSFVLIKKIIWNELFSSQIWSILSSKGKQLKYKNRLLNLTKKKSNLKGNQSNDTIETNWKKDSLIF